MQKQQWYFTSSLAKIILFIGDFCRNIYYHKGVDYVEESIFSLNISPPPIPFRALVDPTKIVRYQSLHKEFTAKSDLKKKVYVGIKAFLAQRQHLKLC